MAAFGESLLGLSTRRLPPFRLVADVHQEEGSVIAKPELRMRAVLAKRDGEYLVSCAAHAPFVAQDSGDFRRRERLRQLCQCGLALFLEMTHKTLFSFEGDGGLHSYRLGCGLRHCRS